jgi:uncharacterized protein
MVDKRPFYSNEESNKKDISKDGMVEIKDGKIIVTDPIISGKGAKISPGKDVKLFIDGVEVKVSTIVFKHSKINTEIPNTEPKRKVETRVDNNKLKGSAVVIYEDGLIFGLKDHTPSNEIIVEAVPSDTIACPHLTLAELKTIIKSKDIVYGIVNDATLNELISRGSLEPVIIAGGKAPINGTDDIIDLKFDESSIKKFDEVEDRVDFYSIGKIVSVEPGQLVAEKILGTDGISGIDIFGKTIPPLKAKRITLSAGKGVKVIDGGLKVYSETTGRPEAKNSIINVYEVYEVPGDVNVSTGNIEFSGDVLIKGSVAEGMRVKSGGRITLYGNVTNGHLIAGGDITVYKNIISSEIKAGFVDFLKYNIIENIESTGKIIMAIFSAALVLKETGKIPTNYSDGQIIKLLIDTKFNNIALLVFQLRDILSNNRDVIDDDTIKLGARLIKYFIGKGPLLFESLGDLKGYADAIDMRIDELRNHLKQPANIFADYIQNSTLSTSGNIRITGKGCYNSTIDCLNEVIFERSGSVMRGGSINAGKDVKIHELGSAGGANTFVSTQKDYVITCEIAYLNSTIRVGNMSSTLDASVKKVKAYLYKGELMVEKSNI